MYENITPPELPDNLIRCSYNGVELPALPEWNKEAHPCACIYWQEYSDGTGRIAVLRLSDNPIDIYDDVGHTYRPGLHQTWWIGDDGAWHVHDTSTHSGTSNLGGFGHPIYFHMLWGNYDIYDEHGVLHIPASEPVPVLAYPYSVMVYDYQKGAEDWYQVHLYYSATPFTWNGEAVGNSGTVYKRIYDAAYDGWTEEAETEIEASPGLTGTTYQRIYTSHDIPDSSGNIWLAAGSVTEAVETVTEKWLRSFRVGLALGLTGKLLPVQEETVIAVQLQNVLYIKKAPAEVSGSILILWGGKGA